MLKESFCRICGSNQSIYLREIDKFKIYRCLDCSVGFSDALYQLDLSSLYTEQYFQGTDNMSGYADYLSMVRALEHNARKRLLRLESRRKGEHDHLLLDVGCGTGVFLNVARRKGWRCRGVEVSEFASNYGRKEYGLDIYTGTLEKDLFKNGTFSVITLWDVIEHLPDPLATLNICERLLGPEGEVVLSTGDINSLCARLSGRLWHLLNVPEHVFYFNRQAISILLMKAGFYVESITYPSSHYPIGYLLERLYKTLLRSTKGVPKHFGSALMPCNLFDVMEVVARKNKT